MKKAMHLLMMMVVAMSAAGCASNRGGNIYGGISEGDLYKVIQYSEKNKK